MSRRIVIAISGCLAAAVGLLVGVSSPSTASTGAAVGGSTGPVWSVVKAGEIHTCGLRIDHTLWCWGNNDAGQLGVGDTSPRSRPTQVGTGSDWAQLDVAADGDDTCAVRTSGTLWCWGWNGYGQLGLGDTQNRLIPTQVGTRAGWATVSLGQEHTCAIRIDHSLWCWGDNRLRQLGLGGASRHKLFPTRVGTPADSTWAQVGTGDFHTCATRLDHTLWCWGANLNGQLGLGGTSWREASPVQVGTDADWENIRPGSEYSCATRTDHTLWCWGMNWFGQLGLGDFVDRYIPTQVGTDSGWVDVGASYFHVCATRTDHTLWCWGEGYPLLNQHVLPAQVGDDTDWATVTNGYEHTCGIRTDATLWCWGDNSYAQLGLGDHEERRMPTQV